MNLIELANDLKDVPDQFLLKEVQAPSGAYPAYMVVSELTRRKRMRESAQKEMPETTVTEDLVGEQERARAMAQMQQAQQMIPPQGGLNAPAGEMAGLGALPEAQGSLAAQDAMGTTPPEMMMPVQGMAGGGMVSFKEGGNVQRFQVGGQPMLRSQLERYSQPASSMSELFGKLVPSVGYTEETLFLDPVTGDPVTYQQYLDRFSQRTAAQPAAPVPAAAAAPVPTPATAPAAESVTAPAPANVPAAYTPPTSPYMSQQQAVLSAMRDLAPPTAEQDAAAAAAGRTEFGEQVPFRMGFMEDYIKGQQKRLEGREGSNINEALMQAGLGIMGSKSRNFLQAVSEGGLSGLRAYKEGQKDIRQGEKDILQARADFAKAQTLYDAEKYGAGDKARQRGLERYKMGMDKMNTESAIIARLGAQEESLKKSGREEAKLPYDIAESVARTKYYSERPQALDKSIATPDQISAARAQAMISLPKGATQAQIESQLDSILSQSGLRRAAAPATTSPLNRGTL